MSFRDNMQHLRATRNMTQEQLAMLLGVSRPTGPPAFRRESPSRT